MICKEVMRKLEERWNPSYALEWDNVGLLVGREEKEIKKTMDFAAGSGHCCTGCGLLDVQSETRRAGTGREKKTGRADGQDHDTGGLYGRTCGEEI